VILRRHLGSGPRRRRFALALFLTALIVLVVPALAAAAEFEVNGTGDTGTPSACETKVGECTMRGALAAANAGSGEDEITFASSFDGGVGSTITLGSQLTVSQPVKILAAGCPARTCVTLQRSTGTAIFVTAAHSVIEGFAIETGVASIGILIIGGEGSTIFGNTFTISGAGTTPRSRPEEASPAQAI
jgi:hypothetical protein